MRILMTAVIVLCASANISSAADEAGLNALRAQIGNSRSDVATVRKQALERFRRADVDDVRGVSQADFDQQIRMQEAQQRAAQLMMSLARDLDGDGRVTRSELRLVLLQQARQPLRSGSETIEPTEEQVQILLDKLVATALQADSNGDGILTFEEIYALAATQQRPGAMRPYVANAGVPLSLDANGDGIVSLAEYEAALDIVLREMDLDGDGKISPVEHEAYQPTQNAARQAQEQQRRAMERQAKLAELAKTCRLPQVPAGALVAAVGTHQGAALSSVAIGEGGAEVRVANIDIQDGERPIYIIARSTLGTIWRLTGAVSRVAQVVAMSHGADDALRSGVVGIDKSRVAFRSSSTCQLAFAETGHVDEARETLSALLGGMRPDIVVAASPLARVRFPIGMTSRDHPIGMLSSPPIDRGSRAVYDEMIQKVPLGIAEIDPKAVVASQPARYFEVLPGYAGLLQLIERRALEVTEFMRGVRIGRSRLMGDIQITDDKRNSATPIETPSGFRVLAKMTFPSGLDYSMNFVVPTGIPVPLGNPAPAKVACESGAPLPKPGEPCP